MKSIFISGEKGNSTDIYKRVIMKGIIQNDNDTQVKKSSSRVTAPDRSIYFAANYGLAGSSGAAGAKVRYLILQVLRFA
jgi:hypothetical protein